MKLDLWGLSLRAGAARRANQPVVLERTEAALVADAQGRRGWPDLLHGVPVRIVEDDAVYPFCTQSAPMAPLTRP